MCDGKEIVPTLRAQTHGNIPMVVNQIGNINPSHHGMNGNIFSSNGVAPSVLTNKGEGNKICVPVLTPDRTEKRQNGRRFKEDGEEAFTITAQDRHGVGIGVGGVDMEQEEHPGMYVQMSNGVVAYAVWYEKYQRYIVVRKLTPKECFRLQGWTDDYFEKAQFVNSDSQLYKQAGNGVTVTVVKVIAEAIINADKED